MDLGQFNKLPEWDDQQMRRRLEKGEEWKILPQIQKAKTLYNKWREIFPLVESFCDTLQITGELSDLEEHKKLINQHLFLVAPKILGAAVVDLYMMKMENASIIRSHCRELMEQIRFLAMVGAAEDKYAEAIDGEMDHFKELFRDWVTSFHKDEYEDEWGLFN